MATGKDHKAFKIDFNAPAQGYSTDIDNQSSKKKTETAPGFMADILLAESNAIKENRDLKVKLEVFDGSLPSRKIDPKLIVRSKWANRLEQSFHSQDFINFKEEIANAGGNIQPIKVRPLAELPGKYEIIFGHRRHQACLETGNEVLAIIDNIDDKSLFIEMDRENRLREDLRPYEQGVMYKRALDEGMFQNSNLMANAIGVDASNIRKAIAMAELPTVVLDAFESRMDIQYSWSQKINFMLKNNYDLIINRAHEIILKRNAGESIASVNAFAILLNDNNTALTLREVKVGSKSFKIVQKGHKTTFEFTGLDIEKTSKLEEIIQDLLSS